MLQPGLTFQIGVEPRRIDSITEIDGVSFEQAYPNKVIVELEGLSIPVINRDDLLVNKKASGRPQDLADVAWLESQA